MAFLTDGLRRQIIAPLLCLCAWPHGLSAKPDAPLVIEGAARHPTVFLTPEDVIQARQNVGRYRWAKEMADAVVREADTWLTRDDAWLRTVVPAPGAAFAYGVTGCPVCGAFWGAWGRGAASFEQPGTLVCKNGHRMPDRAYPDAGKGYMGPDGRIHYVVGTYNAWVVETLTFQALESLAYAYTLTGDERYAAKASVILDALAAVYPACHIGCWDYPAEPNVGRFNRPAYQACRVLVHYVDQYDQLFNSPVLDQPSVTTGLTRHQNIEENLLKDGGAFSYEGAWHGRLHNGTADYVRGALAVGACLGIPDYVRLAADSPFGIRQFLANSIGRDGDYAETTAIYSDHSRELYFTFAEPLRNYRGSAYPQGINLYADPKFRRFLEPHNLPLHIAGHMPRYGDSQPDLLKREPPSRPFDRSDYDFLEKLWTRTADPEIGALLSWVAEGRFDWLRSLASVGDDSGRHFTDRRIPAGISLYREPGDTLGGSFTDRMWMLFHAGEPPPGGQGLPAVWSRRLLGSDFQGQKGLAVLRAGTGANASGLMLRYGPALNHAHLDDLNINFFAAGYELTYDLGYGITAGTQTQVGWAKQTASHNVVVVNEKSQRTGGTTGGSLTLFADTPAVKACEASSELSYASEGVSVYRRTAALVGSGDGAYWVDFFRVRGGHQHDWLFHSIGTDTVFSGLSLGPAEAGSLAGPEISWSDQLLPDGDLKTASRPDLAGHLTALAAPGNGYGFLIHPARGRPAQAWSADWRIDAQTHLRVHVPAGPAVEVISATASGLYPDYPQAGFIVLRRRGENLDSQFMAAIEPHAGASRIETVERLALDETAADIAPMAMKIELAGGRTDYLYSSADAVERHANGLTFGGRFAYARFQGGTAESIMLVGGNVFAGNGWRVEPANSRWVGTISELDLRNRTFLTSIPLPTDGSLTGAVIGFGNPVYSRTTSYRVARVEALGKLSRVEVEESLVLGVGEVQTAPDAHTLTSNISHEYAYSDTASGEHGFFQGKGIVTADGASAVLLGVKTRGAADPLILTVTCTDGFKPGGRFEYADVQNGDRFEILSTCTLTRVAGQQFEAGGDTSLRIDAPAGTAVSVRRALR